MLVNVIGNNVNYITLLIYIIGLGMLAIFVVLCRCYQAVETVEQWSRGQRVETRQRGKGWDGMGEHRACQPGVAYTQEGGGHMREVVQGERKRRGEKRNR